MKKLLICFILFISYNHSFTQSIANVDSLVEVVFSLPDMQEREYAVIWVDSLNNRFFPDSLKTTGLTCKSNWIDNERIRNGATSSKLVKLLTFEQKFYTMYFSDSDLSAIVEKIHYQDPDSAFKRIFAADSTSFTGEKFPTLEALTSFVNDFEAKYIRQVKVTHNTTYHASTFTGDDLDSGLTWPLAVLTLGAVNGLNPTAGDSVLLHGTFTETWSPDDDGTSGNQIMVYDSLSGTNGINFTNPDTTNLWSAIIDPTTDGIDITGDDFWRFHGIRITSMAGNGINIANSTGVTFIQMRFDSHADGVGGFISINSGTANNDSVISCVFMEASGVTNAILVSNAGTSGGTIFINNSMYGVYTGTLVDQNDTDGPTIWINNAFDQTSSVAADRVFAMDDATPTTNMEFNNNMVNKGEDNNFRFNSAVFNSITVWADSTNNYLAGNSANSVDDDPEFQGVTTTLFIDTNSPAFDAGVARGGFQDASNPSIGWYQPVSAVVRSRFIPIF